MRTRLLAAVGLVIVLGVGMPALALVSIAPTFAQPAGAPDEFPYRVYLPLLLSATCDTISGETYGALVVNPPPTDRPAEEHADLNLALRGYTPTEDTLGLVDYAGPTDSRDPQLDSLFADRRLPVFTSVARVYDWDWSTNARGEPITDPPVTLLGAGVAPNELLYVPTSGYNIGTRPRRPARGVFRDAPGDDPNAYEALVLYASEQRITLKYTREDNVIKGYTIHLENVCVAEDLLALYRQLDAQGRIELPALKAGQVFARARGTEIGIVIRDSGAFMDPRSRKDWWKGH